MYFVDLVVITHKHSVLSKGRHVLGRKNATACVAASNGYCRNNVVVMGVFIVIENSILGVLRGR